MSRLVVVSVGTDHHPFDRMIKWMDDWDPEESGLEDVEVLIQAGTSCPSVKWKSEPLIPFKELCEKFESCAVVVSHGGPSTVMDVRKFGKLPIVVARDPKFGEHVDNHQMMFAEHMLANNVAKVVKQQEDLYEYLVEALEQPHRYTAVSEKGVSEGVQSFARLLDSMLGVSTPLSEEASSQ